MSSANAGDGTGTAKRLRPGPTDTRNGSEPGAPMIVTVFTGTAAIPVTVVTYGPPPL